MKEDREEDQAKDSSSFDPLGQYIRQIVKSKPEEVLKRADFVELLQVSVVPGACSAETSLLLSEYIESDDNVAAMITMLLENPEIDRRKVNRDVPTYNEYALNYNAYTLLCLHRFSLGIGKKMFPGVYLPSKSRNIILARLSDPKPFDPVIAEGFYRFFTEVLDNRSFDAIIKSFGPYWEEILEGCLYHIGSPPISTIASRLFRDTPEEMALELAALPYQLLQQLFRDRPLKRTFPAANDDQLKLVRTCSCAYYHDAMQRRTYDFLLTNINSGQGFASSCVDVFRTDRDVIQELIDGCLEDLAANTSIESYPIKVLNLLLQDYICGCIDETSPCQLKTTVLWSCFLERLDAFLAFVDPANCVRFSVRRLQVVYLLFPLLRFECTVVDTRLLDQRVLKKTLELVIRFKRANILHAAVSRLFILVLQDHPMIFERQVETARTNQDILRQAVVNDDQIISYLIQYASSISIFIEISIALNRAVQDGTVMNETISMKWKEFRTQVLTKHMRNWDTSQNFTDLPVSGAVFAVKDAERDMSPSTGGSGRRRKDSLVLQVSG